ncbi:hypothetical protein B0H12DRAFT_1078763 [Mycena haematopus]|nr:hypothetical protein B0H12DRAFT_1078763 [Mycena haematopus]
MHPFTQFAVRIPERREEARRVVSLHFVKVIGIGCIEKEGSATRRVWRAAVEIGGGASNEGQTQKTRGWLSDTRLGFRRAGEPHPSMQSDRTHPTSPQEVPSVDGNCPTSFAADAGWVTEEILCPGNERLRTGRYGWIPAATSADWELGCTVEVLLEVLANSRSTAEASKTGVHGGVDRLTEVIVLRWN